MPVLMDDAMLMGVPTGARLLLAGLLMVLCARASPAQTHLGSGVIDGAITDSALAPLADAAAWLLGSKLEVLTGANGRFRIERLPAGRYLLLVRRIGFTPVSTAVQVDEGETARVWFSLNRLATALDTVRIMARNESGRLSEFDMRRKMGDGQFMTQAEIEKLNLQGASDLLRRFMAVTIVGGSAMSHRSLPAQGCPYQFFIDGVAIPTPKIDIDLPSPKEIAGIEVYTGPASIPLQYKNTHDAGFCGVILLWTRSGG
jgi:hypothetical protein